MNNATDKKILILLMAGGGTRGILQAQFLSLLEQESTKTIPTLFDFFSGVSIGGIHALIFAADKQYQRGKLLDMYNRTTLQRIFAKRMWGWIARPKYKASGKGGILADIFKEQRLKDVPKPVMVSAYDYINAKACYFSTYSNKQWMQETHIKNIAEATSAAPTYFPPKFIYSRNAYFMDGGVISNNPCLEALTEAIKQGYLLKNIRILSLGTGALEKENLAFGKESMKWGKIQWITRGRIINQMIDASTDSSVCTCGMLLQKNFMHIPFAASPPSFQLDCTSSKYISELKDVAKREFEKIRSHLLKFISS